MKKLLVDKMDCKDGEAKNENCLDKKWVMAILYAKPEVDANIDSLKRRIGLLTSYRYNTLCEPTALTIDKLSLLIERLDKLNILQNAVQVAISRLSELQKEIITSCFFKRITKDLVISKLKISETKFKYQKTKAINCLSFYLFMFGFNDERFLEYFDEESIIIKGYETYRNLNCSAKRLKRRKDEERHRGSDVKKGVRIQGNRISD